MVNPNLSSALRADYDALQGDLREATELASDFQKQLSGKSKELAHLRFLFDQTRAHLAHMQDGIAAMRQERHRLANEAMRAMALDALLKRMTAERDRLRTELDGVLEGLADEAAAKVLRFDERDARIAELTVQVVTLKQELAEARRSSTQSHAPAIVREPKTASIEHARRADDDDSIEVTIAG